MPWTVYSRREATSRAARELITDPTRSDASLAQASGTSTTTIGSVRARLEQVGVIPRVPPSARTARPRPPQLPSPTQLAIAALGPDATPRAVADAASVSLQAAWKALRKARPPLTDAAAATDTLHVTKMPRPLTDQAAAADSLRVTRPRRAPAPAQPPAIRPLPPDPPDFSRGLCTTVSPRQRSWWTSRDRDEREAARRMCGGCPVLEPCQQWSLALPVTDNSIWAGMSQTERLKRKREARAQLTIQALQGYVRPPGT